MSIANNIYRLTINSMTSDSTIQTGNTLNFGTAWAGKLLGFTRMVGDMSDNVAGKRNLYIDVDMVDQMAIWRKWFI